MIGKGKDYYKVLGVDRKATQDDIERAYKVKFSQWGRNPEQVKNSEALKKFEEFREAYMTLRNFDRRSSYDRSQRKAMDMLEAQDVFESFFHENGIEGEMEKEFFKEHYPSIKESPYEVLGLKPKATPQEVQKAYRAQVVKAHPAGKVRNPEIEKKFIKITEAYKELVDREKQAKLEEEKKKQETIPISPETHQVLEGIVKKLSKAIQKDETKNKPSKNERNPAQKGPGKEKKEKEVQKNKKRTNLPKRVQPRSSSSSSYSERNRRASGRDRVDSSSEDRDRRDSTSSVSSREYRRRRKDTGKKRRDSTSSVSSEEYARGRKRVTWNRKEVCPSRRDQRTKCDRKKARRDRRDSSSEYTSEDSSRDYRRRQRKPRKDRRDSSSEYTSEGTSSGYSSDTSSYSSSRSYDRKGRRDTRKRYNQGRGYGREDRRFDDERRRSGGPRRYDDEDDYTRNRSRSRIEKKYTSGNKWHADYAEKGYYDVARENEPRDVVIKHLKETGFDVSALTKDAQPKYR